jgi:hypothetical protein
MSKDRLAERLREVTVPSAAGARERAVAEARAELGSATLSAQARERLPGAGFRRALALAAAALLAVVFLLTPPGRAASAWVGELVGIGDVGGEPTQPGRTFGKPGTAVVIDIGTAPDGSRYEWVAYTCEVDLRDEGEDTHFTGIGLSFEWPGVNGHEGGGICEELQGRPRARDQAIGSHGVHLVPSQTKGVERPDLVISGSTGPGVHDVKVLYVEPDGTQHELPVDFARVEGELRELAHRPEPIGIFVAFLDGDIAARDEIEQRLDLRALLDTGKLRLGPVARRERERARAARERCETFEQEKLSECLRREMPPSPFVYVAYGADGREVGRLSESLITASVVRPGDVEAEGRESPGEERRKWSDYAGHDSDPVELMSGRAPDGALYEVVMSRHPGAPGRCMTIWWPYVADQEGGAACGDFPPEGAYEYRDRPVSARPWGFLTPHPHATTHHLLSGFTRPAVSRVRVVYEGKDGRRHDARVQLGQVEGELAERIEARRPTGFWVAFIPRSAGMRPVVEVIAYDEDGTVSSRIRYRA